MVGVVKRSQHRSPNLVREALRRGGLDHTPLLAFLVECWLLTHLRVGEVIIAVEDKTEVWLPEDRDQGCSIIELNQGIKADGKRLTRGS